MSDETDREQPAPPPPPSLVEESQCLSLDWASTWHTCTEDGHGEADSEVGFCHIEKYSTSLVFPSLLGQRSTWL